MKWAAVVIGLSFVVAASASGQVQKWVDEEGTVHLGSSGAPGVHDAPGLSPSIKGPSSQASVLKEQLAYLLSVSEVAWVDIYDNNVYVGLNAVPQDLGLIVGAAALHGNRAINFGVHVWAVNSNFRESPLDGYRCSATARYGKVQKNDC